ncbi:Hypothetical protein NocV09_05000290 [Nannochloropsis oceanica]
MQAYAKPTTQGVPTDACPSSSFSIAPDGLGFIRLVGIFFPASSSSLSSPPSEKVGHLDHVTAAMQTFLLASAAHSSPLQ